ncbi:MAG: hypothetical protein AW08_03937 [Candidatus Accumulibacter adjunctus]|uniref:Uncharacterized protein n=1 Tax=Candidatus Accumulibacter adjunctus TaxID=1454001 RepID=A0A011MM63_9PROT|nr:MAG: hypothetical protein AW08_03937 [Candidatus Accumulibacter adjunctus]
MPASSARTSPATCSAFAPGSAKTATCAVFLPFRLEKTVNACWLSSTRATSFRRTSEAVCSGCAALAAAALPIGGGSLLTTMSSNWATVDSRPSAFTVSWRNCSAAGGPPTCPATTCAFCRSIARCTCMAVRP